jgi:hypothetical protein
VFQTPETCVAFFLVLLAWARGAPARDEEAPVDAACSET